MPCFYTPYLKKTDTEISISGEEFHHIKNVFRKNVEDEILLTSGNGLLAEAEITNISKKEISVSVSKIIEEKIFEPKIAVAFSLLKNKHDNLIIEKLTEIGVKDFFPIVTERTVRKSSKNTEEKFEKVAISAIKQCDNAFLPEIHKTQKVVELLKNIRTYEYFPIIALEKEKQENLHKIIKILDNKSICIIIGPEGGFADEEIEYFSQKQIPTFSLGNHIIRAETAAIVSASQVIGLFLEKNKLYY